MTRVLLLLCFTVIMIRTFSQTRVIMAERAAQSPQIDGDLNEDAWKTASTATDFIQFFPQTDSLSSVRTEVRIVYDDEALYIGAYLYDDPSLIRKQLTARDGEQETNADYFSVFFDTYNDQQNGFQFLVTSANVQSDAKLAGTAAPGNYYGDASWDAVWQSKTSIQKNGWTAEMRIPYLSLRFVKKDVQTWGLQFLRFVRRNSETSYWNPVQPNRNGFVNQFGKLHGLQNIRPPLRLSFSPYLSGGIRFNPESKSSKNEWLRNGGMDVKYGINESFTLDATLVPDFGQVVSDNVVNNLSPYEVRFQENRPFFSEGTELFNKSGLFYSRRIGSTPSRYYDVVDYGEDHSEWVLEKNPSLTQLYNAVKFSGRTEKKLGIGVFNAVTAPVNAHLHNALTNRDTVIHTEFLTNYNIIVLDQAFKGRSSVTFTNTNVVREGADRDANVSALDFSAYDRSNEYALSGSLRYSKIYGLTPYTGFTSTVFDSVHTESGIFIRPYDGYSSRLKLAKVSGKLQYFISGKIISDKFDPNDLGYQLAANRVDYSAGLTYSQYQPTKRFINYSYSLTTNYNWLYKPYLFSSFEVVATGFWVFKNMWDVRLTAGGEPVWKDDYFELRTPGKKLKIPKYFYVFLSGATDSRKRLLADYQLGFAEAALPRNPYFFAETGIRYRFSNKFSLSLRGDRKHDKSQVGYAFLREANGEPIMGFREYKELTTTASGSYNFTSRMNFTLRTRHYWSSVYYQSFYNVANDGFYIKRLFLPSNDYNFNAFHVDAFFTWDFKPGSRVVTGWKNWLSNDHTYSAYDGQKYYSNNLKNSFSLPHGNELTVKLICFFDYNQLHRKRAKG